VLAAALVALARHSIGNRYRAPTLLVFALVGVVGTAVVPWLGFAATSGVLREAAAGRRASGLTGAEIASLQDSYCFLPAQSGYLGGGRTVGQALAALPGPDWLLGGRAMVFLVAAPVLALLLTWMPARLAVRRGPSWPGWLLWLPFGLLFLGTLSLDEGVVSQLWVGYVVGIVPGLLLVLLIGRPRWSVINRPAPAAGPPERPAQAGGPDAPEPPAHSPGPPPELPPTRALPEPSTAPLPSAQAPAPLPPTRQGPRFRRLRRLGEGGFGDVWLAKDTVLGREVAIKVARAADPDTERRIRREAGALAAVHHPHCVRVYDILDGLDALPGLAIVMEYVPGPSLGQQVRRQGPLSDTAGAHLWATLAGALDAAHSRGVLHRDVKPSNVIVDDNGQAHLIDFGIARAEGDPAMTATGLVIGTPDFLSPEVAAGAVADARADSWQLAATVSYALCGHPPRGERQSVAEVLRAAADREPLTQLPVRSAHLGLLQWALHPHPRRRPTLAQVQFELVNWLARTGRPAQGPVTGTIAVPPRH
jgi:tRNA A-37 threonylcarbamoyl transferase component Bud32